MDTETRHVIDAFVFTFYKESFHSKIFGFNRVYNRTMVVLTFGSFFLLLYKNVTEIEEKLLSDPNIASVLSML